MRIPEVLADRDRVRALLALRDQDITANEIAQVMGVSSSAASYQIRQLVALGLVVGMRSDDDARHIYFRLNEPMIRQYIAELHAAFFETTDVLARNAMVLFVCRANSARSQMAAAWARYYYGQHIRVTSAGLHADHVHPYTITVMQEVGIDLRDAPVTALSTIQTEPQCVISVCDTARETCLRVFPKAQCFHWSIPDPARRGNLDEFRHVRDTLKTRVRFFGERRNIMQERDVAAERYKNP